MAVSDPYYSQRVCNCCDCSFLKYTGKQTDAGGYGYFYYCDIKAGDFPYGYNCVFRDGNFYNSTRIFKVYVSIDTSIGNGIKEPFYVYGVNKKIARKRFLAEFPLLSITDIKPCTEYEAIDVLQSENIEII